MSPRAIGSKTGPVPLSVLSLPRDLSDAARVPVFAKVSPGNSSPGMPPAQGHPPIGSAETPPMLRLSKALDTSEHGWADCDPMLVARVVTVDRQIEC